MKTMILMAMTVATVAVAGEKNVKGAYLYGAQLKGVDFRGADLGKAELAHADLRNADFRGAKLANAYLHGANLAGADLRGAELPMPMKLHHVNLTGAKFDDDTRLPFAEAEAVERGMVKVETMPELNLPAEREVRHDAVNV